MQCSNFALATMVLSGLSGTALGGSDLGIRMDSWMGPAPEVRAMAPMTAEAAGGVEIPRGLAAAIMATIDDPTLDVKTTVAACYDAEHPPKQEVIDWMEMNLYGGARDYQIGSRWPGSQGNPVSLTWSIVPDGLSIPNGIGEGTGNSEMFSRLDSQFSGQGGRATWISRVQSVFDRWQELSGITYSRIKFNGNDWDDGASWSASGAANLRGDIRISMKNIDGGNGVLAYNNFPGSGVGGNMVLDRSENWASSPNSNRFMRNILAHENGHGIGIYHVCPANQSKLMEPYISTAYDGPRHDDLRAAQRHYGDPYEPDNNTVEATNLGTLAPGSTTRPSDVPGLPISNGSLLSIDANGETDYFKFSIGGNSEVTVTVAPVGLIYQQGPQQGNCNTGNNYDSKSVADLGLQIVDAGGINVIAQSSSNGLGQSESVTIQLTPGTYFARIYETNNPSQSQLYSLEIGVSESETERVYMAFTNPAAIPGVGNVQNEDIVSYDPDSGTWSLVFDGSDVGLATAALNAFAIAPGGQSMFMSFTAATVVPGLLGGPDGENVDDSDIVQFFPITLGTNTSGNFLFYFDGSDVGLTTNGEDINSLGINGDGKMVMSTVGNGKGNGATWTRQDLVEFTETQHGSVTAGTFALYFDGSDVGLTETTENLDGGSVRADGTIMMSTTGVFSVAGASGTSQDLLLFTPSQLGANTSGSFTLFLDLSSVGINATENVVCLSVTADGPQGDIVACPADLNGDEVLDVFDYLAFQNLFAAGDLDADFDADGMLSIFDFFEYQNLFILGC